MDILLWVALLSHHIQTQITVKIQVQAVALFDMI